MRTTVLVCWAVVATLVVATEAKPFRYVSPSFDIAAAYEAYHQLWMSEAQRNAVAPMSLTPRLARPRPGMRKVATPKKAAPSGAAAEKPAQEKVVTETDKPMVEERAEKPMISEKPTESQTAVEERTSVVTTEEPTQTTTVVEQTATEPTNQEEVTTQMPVEDQTPAEAREASKQVAPKQVLTRTSSTVGMKNAFDDFFTRWNAERIRNSRPPVAMSIPEMRRQLQLQEQRRRMAASRPVDTPTEKPAAEAPVDTLTKAAPTTASDASASAAGSDWLSLAKQQGAAPLIIVLQNPGGAEAVLG